MIALGPVAIGQDFVYFVTEMLTQHSTYELEQAQRRMGYVEKTATPCTIYSDRYVIKGITTGTLVGPT